jgi:hypothetical protein
MTDASTKKTILTPQRRIYYGGILLLLAFFGLFIVPSELFIEGGVVFIASVILFVFLMNIRYGLYAMAVFCFFSNWFIYFGKYEWAKNISYLTSIDAPVVDFIAMLVAVGCGLAWLLQIFEFKLSDIKHIWRLMILYGCFIGWSLLSALRAFDHHIGQSIKYVARPIIFVFLLFLILPNVLIRTKKLFFDVLYIWFGVGVAIALFGLSSLIMVSQHGWWRVVPYGINDVAPLGYNHNLIAEVLIPIIPIAVFFTLKARREGKGRKAVFYGVGAVLIILAELLTLSRAGWISVILQMVLSAAFFISEIKAVIKSKKYLLAPLVIVGVLVVGYMALFLGSSVVTSSNKARFTVSEIVIFYVKKSPFLGHGPGMFIPIFESTRDYVQEFGEALDAHGFIQKTAAEEGLVGLGLFCMSLGYSLYIVWHEHRSAHHSDDRELMIVCLVMMSGSILFQLFNTSYFNSVMWMPVGVGLSAAGILYRHRTAPSV